MSAVEKLMRIQTKIKAPKNLYNSFGKYSYRNAEGICEAVKPFLAEEKCALILRDEMVEVGGRVYVRANAILQDCESEESLSSEAYAREAEAKKGMDESQVTGTASSYARKYALNGLFLLDDTKDEDSEELHVEKEAKAEKAKSEAKAEETKNKEIGKQKISELKVKALSERCQKENLPVDKIKSLYKVKDLADLSENQFANIHANWDRILAM